MERIELVQGDITQLDVEAIVNAANQTLLGGGGVDGAIHRAAGPELKAYCARLGGCPTGEARITPGFRLKAQYVIHAVGPVYKDGQHGEPELLAGCYRHSLELAERQRCKTVAFPAISCGIYGYPAAAAAEIAVHEVSSFLAAHALPEKVLLCCFGGAVSSAYRKALDG